MKSYAQSLFAFAVLLVLSFTGGCQSPASPLTTAQVKIGNSVYNLEIAITDAQREHGLMERDTLAEDGGMIFAFSDAEVREFWMFHTRFDLDILYLDSDGVVVSIKTMKAYDIKSRTSSDYPAKYAIELHVGQAAKNGVKVGEHIVIPPKAAATD